MTKAVKTERRQLGIIHALKYLLFTLWEERMSRDERVEVEKTAKQALFTLVNSTKRHSKDEEKERLKGRIDSTVTELYRMSDELRERGYVKRSSFINRNARFMVTFAQMALEDVEIPYTTNKIERLMGEISKRCKHKWMHWSTRGLRNILTIVLVRYSNTKLYNQFKNAYIHNN